MSEPDPGETAMGKPARGQSASDHQSPASTEQAEAPSATANSAVLRVRTGPLAGPLLIRVVGMMLTRAQCPLDRLDDAMLICDALGAHASAQAADGHVEFTVLTRTDGMELRVGALAVGGAQRLVKATSLPGVGAVLEPIADQVRVEASRSGPGEELVLQLGFGHTVAAARDGSGSDGGGRNIFREPAVSNLVDQASGD